MAYLLQGLLAEAAARHPLRPAVSSDSCVLTYAELDQLSNKVAGALLRLGVAPGDRVAILSPKSAAAVAAAYGALKAGACYVPLDTKAPAERLAYVLEDSGAVAIIADQTRAPAATELAARVPGVRRLTIADAPSPAAPGSDLLSEPAGPPGGELAIETDLAYILYTSGSTGTPKGVMISHRNSLTFVDWAKTAAGLHEEDRVCSPAPLHFDLSVFDVYASCKAGACLAVIPDRTTTFPVSIAKWLERERITIWYSVPSVLTLLACFGGLGQFDLSRLRAVIFAGEVFQPKYLARLMAELPLPRYLNWYGPTETNVCTAYEVFARAAELGPVPIGKACANTEVFAISADGSRVSVPGEEGELYVRGPSVMRGYWDLPAKTREVLVPDPLRPGSGELVYRTGDLVTLEADGNYAYAGRRDAMVKVRGYRVELGEVEAVLYRHDGVADAVVLPVPDELLGSRLRAVVVASSEGGLTREEVLEHCRQWLPGYMVPEVVEFRAALPRTSTGKVDRAGLAREHSGPELAETH
ncbi:MAG TPA: amino acid adenylation domain-containing protein [Streptosporangiaceae bacterium]|nr:amino acid adenylation domain-containing protein [Streptosporangiaceae bacterium]